MSNVTVISAIAQCLSSLARNPSDDVWQHRLDSLTEHVIRVLPTFDGIDIRVSGRNKNMIKEYLGDTFHYCLTRKVKLDIAATGDWKTATYVLAE